MSIKINEDGTLEYNKWIRCGGMMVNRDYLEHDDPNQTYNYLSAHGVDPTEYGIKHPLAEEFDGRSRQSLIDEILALRRTVESNARHFG